MKYSKVFFLGAGPGDTELLTVKAHKILKKSDAVFYAGSLINREALALTKKGAELIDLKGLTYEEIKERLLALVGKGLKAVSILHAGDSSLYSSINEQMAYLEEEGIPYEIIPGVSVAFAAAASNKSALTLPGISQALIFCRAAGRTGGVPEGQDIKSLARHRASMAVYLSFGTIESVVSDLMESYPPETPCLIAKNVSLKDELLIDCALKDVARKAGEHSVKNMAVLLVGEALSGKTRKEIKSKLYDKDFSHAFRKAKGSGLAGGVGK